MNDWVLLRRDVELRYLFQEHKTLAKFCGQRGGTIAAGRKPAAVLWAGQ